MTMPTEEQPIISAQENEEAPHEVLEGVLRYTHEENGDEVLEGSFMDMPFRIIRDRSGRCTGICEPVDADGVRTRVPLIDHDAAQLFDDYVSLARKG